MANGQVMLPKTLSFPGGKVMVQDAFESHRWYGVFESGEKSWTQFFQKMIDDGAVGKK